MSVVVSDAVREEGRMEAWEAAFVMDRLNRICRAVEYIAEVERRWSGADPGVAVREWRDRKWDERDLEAYRAWEQS